jgi:chemotaxis protein methyltransferase CheR
VMELCGDEWKQIAAYVHSICGVQLDGSKRYLIESRLSNLVRQSASHSYAALCQKASADATGELQGAIIDAITTGETSFFRDQSPYELLRMKLLPELIERRATAGQGKIPIRIWSAACSTGQETYSIAMVLREVLGPLEKYNIRLIGTDISPEALQRAAAGVYNPVEVSRGIENGRLARYFIKEEHRWRVRDDIRAMVTYRRQNLLRDFSLLGRFDVIFCRNVAIYFSDADRASLFERLAKAMASDGYLITGATESPQGVCPRLKPHTYQRAAFYTLTD